MQRLREGELAELTAVLEAGVSAKVALAKQAALPWKHRLGWIRKAVPSLTLLNWCYVDLLRRHEEEGLPGEP